MNITWRLQWDYDADAIEREATNIDFTGDPGKTIQEPAEDADINVLMQRFGVKDGSILPYWYAPANMYGDYSNMPDDPVLIANILRDGEIAFMMLPAKIRQRFGSGPELYNWLSDVKNNEEAVELGLLSRETPQKVSINTSIDKAELVPEPKQES